MQGGCREGVGTVASMLESRAVMIDHMPARRVLGSGFRVPGFNRDSGSGFRIPGFERISSSGFQVPGFKSVSVSGLRVPGFGFKV